MSPSIAAVADDPADLDLEALQSTLISALAAVKGQQSASEQIEESTLKLNGNTVEIYTTLSKTMLPVVLNADAEKIMKAALREANAGTLANVGTLTVKLIPGAPRHECCPEEASGGSEWVGGGDGREASDGAGGSAAVFGGD